MASTLPFLFHGMPIGVIKPAGWTNLLDPNNDKILVLIQLQGGNDGLNTVIPLPAYDQLAKLRSNLIIPENQWLPIDDETAFHPSLRGMRNLYNEGQLGVVHSVGYPNQNRSHFRSTDIWTNGIAADEFNNTGWLGRFMDTQHPEFPNQYPNESFPDPLAITLNGITSETCQGLAANYSLAINDPFSLSPLPEGEQLETMDSIYGQELAFVQASIAQTNAYGTTITNAINQGKSMAIYPDNNNLAAQLRNVAHLISGGLQTKIYVCSIGGFDTHAEQVDPANPSAGIHATLLDMVSSAIEAFQQDLKSLNVEERVIGMTFSEFGRQIASNESLGTDHGTAAPLFLFGSCVKPGFTGQNPDIPTTLEPQEGVSMQIDFRDIYGSILQDWFGLSATTVKNLLYEGYTHLPIITGCNLTSAVDHALPSMTIDCFPNPFQDHTNLSFSLPASTFTHISVFDARGALLQNVVNRTLDPGQHQLTLKLSDYSAGNYFIRLKFGHLVQTVHLIKT